MIEKIHYVPKSYFESVKNAYELVDAALKLWRDAYPDEAANFDADMANVNSINGGSQIGKDLVAVGSIPTRLFRIIQGRDKKFFSDSKNMKVFFKVYDKARIERGVRKIVVPSGA